MLKPQNLVHAVLKSGLIVKQIMAQFFQEVFFPYAARESLLLINSLGTYRGNMHIDGVKPKYMVCMLKFIPYLQPLDVLYFRQFKAVLKRIEDHIILKNLEFIPSMRDSFALLMCSIHNLFSSPVFADFITYSWTIPGYDDFTPRRFKTPPEWIFDIET